MPAHLRVLAKEYDLAGWIDSDCPVEKYYGTIHAVLARLDEHAAEGERRDAVLVNLVSQLLVCDGRLEDYVIERPVEGHDTKQPGAFATVHEAAAYMVIQRYERALKTGWTPETDTGEADQ